MSAVGIPLGPDVVPQSARAVRVGAWLFRHRGWLPVPLALFVVAAPGAFSLAEVGGGAALVALGEAIRLWGVAAAGPETRRRSCAVSRLVTHGPFAHTRNPLYLGNACIWAGVSLAAGTPWLLPVTLALFSIEYSLIVRFEESVLHHTFGGAYAGYAERTPRWLPRVSAACAHATLDWQSAWRSERSTFYQYAALTMALSLKFVLAGR